MLTERLLILFSAFIIPNILCDTGKSLEEGEAFEFGIFQELVFQYSTKRCSHSCWDMYNHGFCKIKSSIPGVSCKGRTMSCSSLGNAHFCAMNRGQHKILQLSTLRDDKFYDYGKRIARCHYDQSLSMYSAPGWILNDKYSHCNCRCFKDFWRVHLGQLRSRENDNYVIVGLRLKLEHEVLFLQIAEGRLEANGIISEFIWLPPSYNSSKYSVDLNSRNFFLDDVQLNPGYFLTGVKFEYMEAVHPKKIGGFTIAISGVPFDCATGKLNLIPANRKTVRAQSHFFRKELKYKLVTPADEIGSRFNTPSPPEYNYVKLQQSELENDFGQTTLPLFDSRPVMMSPASPLTGIGIFHHGTKDHAGFISLQLYTINCKLTQNVE